MPPTKQSRQLGQLIYDHRTAKGLPLQVVADAAGTDPGYVYRLERGEYQRPRPDILAAVSRLLEIPLSNLYALAGYPLTRTLPDFEPYLRAKTELPDEAINELQRVFDDVQSRYAQKSARRKRGRS